MDEETEAVAAQAVKKVSKAAERAARDAGWNGPKSVDASRQRKLNGKNRQKCLPQ